MTYAVIERGQLLTARAVIDCAAVFRALVTAVFLSSLWLSVGCARVKPYQRGHLAKPSMVGDRAEAEKRCWQHQTGSREGGDGGTGEPGGGCGCN